MSETTQDDRDQLRMHERDIDEETAHMQPEYKTANDADRLARAEALLRELGEYFDNYADVTDSDRGVAEVPNEAMEWKSRIDAFFQGGEG